MNSAHAANTGRSTRRPSVLSSARTWQTVGIALCLALLVGLTLSYVALIHQGAAGIKKTDFMAYYSGAKLVVEGHGGSLYNFGVLGQLEHRLVYPLRVRNGVLPFVYPPYFALLLAPLAALPYGVAYFLWLGLNLTLLGGVILALQRYLGFERRGSILLWAAALSFLPVFVALAQGQTSLLLLALMTGSLFALRSRHDALAGACLALALVKPPYVAPLLLVLLLQRRWRALTAFAAAAAILAVLPLAVLGSSTDASYFHTLVEASGWHSQFGYGPELNHSFAGLLQLLLPLPTAHPVTLALDAILLLALAYAALVSRMVERPLGLAFVAALLVSPHVLVHDLALCLTPAAILLGHRNQIRGASAVLLAGYCLFFLGLRLVSVWHLQLSVIALTALGIWLFALSLEGRVDILARKQPALQPPRVPQEEYRSA